MKQTPTILVAPLNWGLGHATRCIPIIRSLQANGFGVLIGSDGASLALLRQEFPEIQTICLPSYHISYAKKKNQFKTHFLRRSPKLLKAIRAEHKALEGLITTHHISGVISDNRLGLYSSRIPTVFMTHQLQVLSGFTTPLTTYLHRRFAKRFDECWVPDYQGEPNVSGALGHPKKILPNVRYIGPLSRFKKDILPKKWDILALISGPEPQRTYLEEKLLFELKKYNGNVLLIRGVIETKETRQLKNITIKNYLTSQELEKTLNQSAVVISRSGYTTIMDLIALEKKAFFIPTPGQTEQEYLALRLKLLRIAPFCTQETFTIKNLARLSVYRGFQKMPKSTDLNDIFGLFKGERKLRTNSKFTLNIDAFIMSINNVFNYRKTES
ncbi:MAG: hypothetical protein ACI828_000537 [Flavobacteriales bacterium]|jgi:uncharacterized protein (TIGR00661 family)